MTRLRITRQQPMEGGFSLEARRVRHRFCCPNACCMPGEDLQPASSNSQTAKTEKGLASGSGTLELFNC